MKSEASDTEQQTAANVCQSCSCPEEDASDGCASKRFAEFFINNHKTIIIVPGN